MPVAGLGQVAGVEFASVAVFSAVAPFPQAGRALPRIPGRVLRRFSGAFAEGAAASPAAEVDVAVVDAVAALVSSTPRRCVTPAARYR